MLLEFDFLKDGAGGVPPEAEETSPELCRALSSLGVAGRGVNSLRPSKSQLQLLLLLPTGLEANRVNSMAGECLNH